MSSATQTAATIGDLYRVEGKAELIAGRIVPLMATGRLPNRVAFRICRSLDDFAEATGRGEAYTDNMGFAVPRLSSGREQGSRISLGRLSALGKTGSLLLRRPAGWESDAPCTIDLRDNPSTSGTSVP